MNTRCLFVLITVSLAYGLNEKETIVEKSDAADEVHQLRSKRSTHFHCEDNDDMTNTLRHIFLSAHNDMRESIAKGMEVGRNGLLPRPANMYKLRWSCDLESQAHAWASACENREADHILAQGQNYAIIDDFSGAIPSAIARQLAAWRQQAAHADLQDEIKYNTALNMHQWANMANAETTEVGCSVHNCNDALALTCFYNKQGDIADHLVYSRGAACTYDVDCTAHERSFCVPTTALCDRHSARSAIVEEALEAQGLASRVCPRNAKMSDDARHTVLDWHNAFRSNLAFGREEDGEGAYAPMARGMLKMHYDCALEKSSEEAVERCEVRPYRLGKTGQNIFVTTEEVASHDQVSILQKATKQWWDELHWSGLGYNNTFTRKQIYHRVDHFTQMAWSSTYRIGCATKACGEKYLAVCHYSPSGNKLGRIVYSYGAPCTTKDQCDEGQSCAVDEGLCVVELN